MEIPLPILGLSVLFLSEISCTGTLILMILKTRKTVKTLLGENHVPYWQGVSKIQQHRQMNHTVDNFASIARLTINPFSRKLDIVTLGTIPEV